MVEVIALSFMHKYQQNMVVPRLSTIIKLQWLFSKYETFFHWKSRFRFLRWNINVNITFTSMLPGLYYLDISIHLVAHSITRTSEWVITLWRSCELFCIGIFHKSTGRVKYPHQKQCTWSPQKIITNLFLFLCRTTIDWMLILKVYVCNFKEFIGETAISQFGVVIHNKRGSQRRHYPLLYHVM